jgi:hypothetical protein
MMQGRAHGVLKGHMTVLIVIERLEFDRRMVHAHSTKESEWKFKEHATIFGDHASKEDQQGTQ